MTIGSVSIPLLIGVALGDLLNGLPINSKQNFTGNFFDLLTGYGLMTGVTLLALCLLHGATSSRCAPPARSASVPRGGASIGPVATVVNLAWVIWTLVVVGGGTVPETTQIFGMIAVIFAWALSHQRYDGWAFSARPRSRSRPRSARSSSRCTPT